ncbi:MAG: NAD(+) synthase [Candidatus Didemnitutus sp.]|nr:NAD(+) synthase [Candidatus Didemnitutus sp.]
MNQGVVSSPDFLRVASAAPELRVADVEFNASRIVACLQTAAQNGAALALFPELSLTGYTCGDLFSQALLHERAKDEIQKIAAATRDLAIHAVVGLPLVHNGRLYNCAAVLGAGRVLGFVPKVYLPTTAEYYEERWFTSAAGMGPAEVALGDERVPLASQLLFEDVASGCTFGVEICEDLWAVHPPSGDLALAGANLILNPSASNELLGKADYRRDLVRQQSARCMTAYAYAGAGPGESTTDVVFSGHCMIAENGSMLVESARFKFDSQIVYADVDVGRLLHERLCNSSFSAASATVAFRRVPVSLAAKVPPSAPLGTLRPNPQYPFVPRDATARAAICHEIFAIQSTGLAKRLKHTGAKNVVLGISGGLDSTLALLVTVRAFDLLGLDRKGILAPTLPGFGTTKRTRSNAEKLVELLGATLRVIPIEPAVRQHFADIGHDPKIHDITYENAQARERTQILMDLANKVGGFVVGTGDLSESALGWCTFNGDHMSMYHVNSGVPKTLVRYLVDWCADSEFSGETSQVLHDIADTPISPELLPINEAGAQHQQTEDVVGPYVLHDYFLYHIVRHGSRPAKVLYLAELAFADQFDRATILRWLDVFVRRFFSQQFKRSAMPDGPKVGSVALSPRGDWRMPSDASVAEWRVELARLSKG